MPAPLIAKLSTVQRVIKPRISIKFRLLREGEVTSAVKFLRVFRDWGSISQAALVFSSEHGGGEFTQEHSVDLETMLAQGEWLACGMDDSAPKKTRAVYLSITESGTYTYNITSGEGGGGAIGDPATIQASVRVDGSSAMREIVVIERPSDGQWRVAGYGPSAGVDAPIGLTVTDGQCYAIGLDDWGVPYQPSLGVSVGQTIRPTVYTGWLYRITEAGTLPATEPEWWPIDGDNAPRQLGTARAVAVRYYRPLAHGPVPVEMI